MSDICVFVYIVYNFGPLGNTQCKSVYLKIK